MRDVTLAAYEEYAAILPEAVWAGYRQTAENQLIALRCFATARGWTVTEFVDHGVSGAKEKRPSLDALHAAVRARTLDVVACVKLDRLARSVHHLVAMVREFEALGVDLVVLDQAIDTTTPAGRPLTLPRLGRDQRVRTGPHP